MKWWRMSKELTESKNSEEIEKNEGKEARKRRLPKARWTFGHNWMIVPPCEYFRAKFAGS